MNLNSPLHQTVVTGLLFGSYVWSQGLGHANPQQLPWINGELFFWTQTLHSAFFTRLLLGSIICESDRKMSRVAVEVISELAISVTCQWKPYQASWLMVKISTSGAAVGCLFLVTSVWDLSNISWKDHHPSKAEVKRIRAISPLYVPSLFFLKFPGYQTCKKSWIGSSQEPSLISWQWLLGRIPSETGSTSIMRVWTCPSSSSPAS